MQCHKGNSPVSYKEKEDRCVKCEAWQCWDIRYMNGHSSSCGGNLIIDQGIYKTINPCVAVGEHLELTCSRCGYEIRLHTADHVESLPEKLNEYVNGEKFVEAGEIKVDKSQAVDKIKKFAGIT